MPEAGDAKPGADAGERALLERLNAHVAPGTFQHFLGLRFVRATPDDMLATLNASGLSGFHGTTSGAPFLEIGGDGVTKAHGVAHLAALLGVKPSQVLAVGDARNDVEMLEWSGVGVAMGNAVAEAIAAADHTTATNEEDGLALVIEALLAR